MIQGRVLYAWRGKRKIRIAGGRRGAYRAFVLDLSRNARKNIYSLLRPFYRWLISKHAVKGLFNRFLGARILILGGSDFELHLFISKSVIGRYRSREKVWRIRRPYQRLIDTHRLEQLAKIQPYP
jgi:hypothetical protein